MSKRAVDYHLLYDTDAGAVFVIEVHAAAPIPIVHSFDDPRDGIAFYEKNAHRIPDDKRHALLQNLAARSGRQ
jgi:hypothetical protein